MKPAEKTLFQQLRNQVFATVVAACLAGLGMNFIFMFTINDTVNDLRKENADIRTEMRENYRDLNEKVEAVQKQIYTISK